jgi:hypothetical protein
MDEVLSLESYMLIQVTHSGFSMFVKCDFISKVAIRKPNRS